MVQRLASGARTETATGFTGYARYADYNPRPNGERENGQNHVRLVASGMANLGSYESRMKVKTVQECDVNASRKRPRWSA